MLELSQIEALVVTISMSLLVIAWFGIISYQYYKEIKLLRNIQAHLDQMLVIIREIT